MSEAGAAGLPRQYRRVRLAAPGTGIASVAFLGALTVAAIAGPPLVPYNALTQSLDQALELQGWQHWVGTDDLGRDLLSRLLLGSCWLDPRSGASRVRRAL